MPIHERRLAQSSSEVPMFRRSTDREFVPSSRPSPRNFGVFGALFIAVALSVPIWLALYLLLR